MAESYLELHERNAQELKKVGDLLRNNLVANLTYTEDGKIDFEHTYRFRSLLSGNPHCQESLSQAWFNLPPEDIQGLQEVINGKDILLIGGAQSLSDLKNDQRFRPNLLINTDPFLMHEEVKDFLVARDYYRSVNADISKPNFLEHLEEGVGYTCDDVNENGFDYILTSFSLPYYIQGKEDLEVFMKQSLSLLKTGGRFVIHPVEIPAPLGAMDHAGYYAMMGHNLDKENEYQEIRERFVEILVELNTGEYEYQVSSRDRSLTLVKL